MSKRVRLTKRQAAEDETPYSGDVGNADRTDPKPDAYSIDDYEVPGWELQEDGDPSENDKRLENNVPEMAPKDERTGRKPVASETVTRVRQAAAKAVKLAVLFLGDRVPQSVIEAQAKDFMRLGSSALNNALKRYTATETLYAEEEVVEEEVVETTDETPAEEACETVEAEDETPAEEGCVKSEEEEEMEVPVEVEEEETEVPVEAEEVEEAPAETAEDDDEEEVIEEEVVEAPAAKKATKKPAKKKKAEVAEMDIELSTPEGEVELSEDEEAELASLYAEDDDEEYEEEVEIEEVPAAKKAGVKKLGGQPKVASKGGQEVDLTSLWATEPDVSDVFK